MQVYNDKPHLYLDFDDTLANSLDVVMDILNKKYDTDYSMDDVNNWYLEDCFPEITEEEVEGIFASDEFWDNLTLKDNALDSLIKLNDLYNMHLVSKGTIENLNKKFVWAKKNLIWNGAQIDFIPLDLDQSKGDISTPYNSIIIDDNEDNLKESNATIKILFESYPNKEWNKHWNGVKYDNWVDLYEQLCHLAKLMNGEVKKC